MCHEDNRKLLGILFSGFIQQCLKESGLPFFPGRVVTQYGKVLRIDMGHGCYRIPVLTGNCDDLFFPIHGRAATFNVADNLYPEMIPQITVYFQFGTAVVVSCRNDNGH